MLISCCISFYDTTLLKAKEIYDNMMYLDTKEEAIAEPCLVCCGNCNCKACLRLDGSLKINEDEKVHHSMYLLHALIPFLKHFNQEQLMEKEIEVKIQDRYPDFTDSYFNLPSALELQKAACEKDEPVKLLLLISTFMTFALLVAGRSVMVTCREEEASSFSCTGFWLYNCFIFGMSKGCHT
ncbi:hypothetical protein CsSME_00039882 [Camellia sinensis var. sinensis]